MIKLKFIEHDGTEHEVDADAGGSLMQAAADNLVPGIDGDCGGGCACGTCHVKVDAVWLEKLPAADAMESSLLDMTPERSDNSRLSCQIQITEALDGMVVTLPEFQM